MDIISSISTEVVNYESDDFNDDIAIIDNKTVFVKRCNLKNIYKFPFFFFICSCDFFGSSDRAPKESQKEMSQIIKKMRVTTSEYLVKVIFFDFF